MSIAHEHQQLLTNPQKAVVIKWCIWCSDMGDPLTCAKLQALIHNLMQQEPSETWICRFLKNNADQITPKRAHGLDPKCAQAFNKTAMVGHFKLFTSVTR